jgi:hypothetical protein
MQRTVLLQHKGLEFGLTGEWNAGMLSLRNIERDPHDSVADVTVTGFDPHTDILFDAPSAASLSDEDLRFELELHVPERLTRASRQVWSATEAHGAIHMQRVSRRSNVMSPVVALEALLRALPANTTLLHAEAGGIVSAWMIGSEPVVRMVPVELAQYASMTAGERGRVLALPHLEDVTIVMGPECDDDSVLKLAADIRFITRFNRSCLLKAANAEASELESSAGKEHLFALGVGALVALHEMEVSSSGAVTVIR